MSDASSRETGWYHVLFGGEWIKAEWVRGVAPFKYGCWQISHIPAYDDLLYQDSAFDEIGGPADDPWV